MTFLGQCKTSRFFEYWATSKRFTCKETCQGQEWGLASFPDTILSAMLGLKWAIPQSLGQSKKRKAENMSTKYFVFLIYLEVFSSPHPGEGFYAVAVVQRWVCMQLQAGMPCSTAAAATETAAEAEEVLVQPSSSRESPAGLRSTLFIPSTCRCTHTCKNNTPPGTMSRVTTKAERWIVLL